MRILILSDIHGNLAALEAAIATPHDAVICLGDLVGYGPFPGPVVRCVRTNAVLALQGNHDRALADGVASGCRAQFEGLARATFSLGQRQLSPEEIAYLGALPRQSLRVFDRVRYLFVHATPSDPLYRYLGPDPEIWAKEVAGVDADVVVVGHTHIQFDIQVAGKRVLNPGSVGQPKDGDPRAAYGLLEDGELRFGRALYPVDRTVSALESAGLSTEAFAALVRLLRTGQVSLDTVIPS